MLFGLGGDSGSVVVCSHMDYPSEHDTGVHEGAAHELIAWRFGDEAALSGEQALIHLACSLYYLGIGRDLISAREPDDVSQYDLINGDLGQGGAAHRLDMGGYDDGQLVCELL